MLFMNQSSIRTRENQPVPWDNSVRRQVIHGENKIRREVLYVEAESYRRAKT